MSCQPAASRHPHLLRHVCTFAVALCACTGTVEDPAQPALDSQQIGVDGEALSLARARALRFARRETLVTGITSAENLLLSEAERLYVSGDDGVFELTRDASTGSFVASPLVAAAGCKFGGMAERAATLYAVCYDDSQSYLYAAQACEQPVFSRIFSLPDVTLANGMASDGKSLFISAMGKGLIKRIDLDPADPLRVASESNFLDDSGGLLPNGIKVYAGFVYWGDVGTVRRTPLAGPATTLDVRAQGLTFFDDFSVSDDGVLVADYLFGTVHQYSKNGRIVGSAPAGTFNGPSSVVEAKGRMGFGAYDLIVTEKGANSVAVLHDDP